MAITRTVHGPESCRSSFVRTLTCMLSPPTGRTTIVVIDPTDTHGEAALGALDATDTDVTLVVPIYGRWATPLQDFAEAEDIDIGFAASLYLDQLAGRVECANRALTSVVVDGLDLVHDVISFCATAAVSRIIVPASVVGRRGVAIDRLVGLSPVPVTILPSLSRALELPRTRGRRRAA